MKETIWTKKHKSKKENLMDNFHGRGLNISVMTTMDDSLSLLWVPAAKNVATGVRSNRSSGIGVDSQPSLASGAA